MKSIFYIITAACLILVGFASCSKYDTNFSVEGQLSNLSTPRIYAVKEFGGDSICIDTIDVSKDGSFSFDGKVENPTLTTLFCGEGRVPVVLCIEPKCHIKLKGDALQPELIEVKGGNVNNDLQNFRDKNASLLQAKYRELDRKGDIDLAELRNTNMQLARSVREYVEQNPAKIAAVILMNLYSINNLSAELLGHDINLLKGAAADFYLTTALRAHYDRVKISEEGAIAPPFKLKSTKDKWVELKDFKGKPVLFIFDLKEPYMDNHSVSFLKDSYKELKDKVSFITIIIDEDEKNPDSKLVETANALDWTVLLDGDKWNSKEVRKYNVKTVPYMILISKEGSIEKRDVVLDSLLVKYNDLNIKDIPKNK